MALLATPEQLELYGEEGLPSGRAELLLESASALVRSYCGWAITRETATLTADADGQPVVGLPTLRLVSVSAVRVDGVALSADAFTWTGSGTLRGPGLRGRVEADVVHGHEDVPAEVRLVVLALALRWHLNPAGDQSFAAGGQTVRPTVELLDVERAVLERHRLPGAP